MVLAVRFCLLHRSFLSGTINSKIIGTSKDVYLPISKQNFILVVPNLLVHNTICYYVQVNSLRLKSSVSSKWASKLRWGYHLFCCWWYISSAIEIISDEISPASSNFLTTFSELGPPWCNLANRETEDKENSSFKRRSPVQTHITTEEHGSVFIENREVVPVICSNTVSF